MKEVIQQYINQEVEVEDVVTEAVKEGYQVIPHVGSTNLYKHKQLEYILHPDGTVQTFGGNDIC